MPYISDLIFNPDSGYGDRPDGSRKGKGWLGELRNKDGDIVTELTAQSDIDGKSYDYPLVTPNQSFRNMSELLQGYEPSEDAYRRAIEHMLMRGKSGRTIYAPEDMK